MLAGTIVVLGADCSLARSHQRIYYGVVATSVLEFGGNEAHGNLNGNSIARTVGSGLREALVLEVNFISPVSIPLLDNLKVTQK